MRLEDLPDDKCLWCKAPLDDTRRLGQSFCSRSCYRKHYDAIDQQRRAEARSGLICRECGITFAGARADQLYCSKACSRMAMRKTTWGYRTCRICDRTFLPNHKGQFMCVEPYRYMECVERLRARLPPAPAREERASVMSEAKNIV
jgi:hypothetical protein